MGKRRRVNHKWKLMHIHWNSAGSFMEVFSKVEVVYAIFVGVRCGLPPGKTFLYHFMGFCKTA